MLPTSDRYVVVDVETTIKNLTIGTNKAHFADPNNFIVASGVLAEGKVTQGYKRVKMLVREDSTPQPYPTLIVGHNVRFDILHNRKELCTEGMENWLATGKIWDTAHVAYLLSAQTHKFPALDELSKALGLPIKDDRIKALWESGVQTEDIDRDMLLEYNDQDLTNTNKIFLWQIQEVQRLGMMPLVLSQMDALMALIEMEWNGMYVSRDGLEVYGDDISFMLSDIERNLKADMAATIGIPYGEINPDSLEQLNLYLFGGVHDRTVRQAIQDADGKPVLFKSGAKKGQVRFKNVKECVKVAGVGCMPLLHHEMTKQGLYKLDDDTLAKYTGIRTTRIREYRRLSKELKTYVEGYKSYIWPTGYIHPNFNTTQTATGRLSSSQPNMQNLTRADD